MHAFHIHYRNTQGTLMRILTAVSRRGLEMFYVQACADGHGQRASLLLDVNSKQIGQLCRDWYAIVDVMDVAVGTPYRRDARFCHRLAECASASLCKRKRPQRQRRDGIEIRPRNRPTDFRKLCSAGHRYFRSALPAPLGLNRRMCPAPNSTE